MDFKQLDLQIGPADTCAAARMQRRLDSAAKPVGSLGTLETHLTRIAALTGSEQVSLTPRTILVMCADNGVAARDVAMAPQRITKVMAELIADGRSNISHMAQIAGARVLAFDVGMLSRSENPRLHAFHAADGTRNIAAGPAMTKEEALSLIAFGMEQARLRVQNGDRLLAAGEMGIGNTTTAAAMAAVLLNRPVQELTGRGAGLDDEGLARKMAVIGQAIAVNRPDPSDALDVLVKLGGYDIAAMCGVYLGAALYQIPILLDGFISSIAALTAAHLCPSAQKAMLASHVSAEPAGQAVLDALQLQPLICAGMRLGEGTGAAAAMPMLDMALAIIDHMPTLRDIGM